MEDFREWKNILLIYIYTAQLIYLYKDFAYMVDWKQELKLKLREGGFKSFLIQYINLT